MFFSTIVYIKILKDNFLKMRPDFFSENSSDLIAPSVSYPVYTAYSVYTTFTDSPLASTRILGMNLQHYESDRG